MFRIYKIFRATGYALTLGGLLLFVLAGPSNPEMKGAGCLAMAAGFGCIFVTYGIYLISRRRK